MWSLIESIIKTGIDRGIETGIHFLIECHIENSIPVTSCFVSLIEEIVQQENIIRTTNYNPI